MASHIPYEHQVEALHDLQSHGRCIAYELISLAIPPDTMVRTPQQTEISEGWEIPEFELPARRPLMLNTEGIFTSLDPRIVGREVKPLTELDVAAYGAALAIRKKLFALEKKHDIFGKIKKGKELPPSI